ncbi:vitamin B12 ABC transporter ATP-binding protein BtuD [Pluralibacter sp.]|uniref:vitamin B12 ABC transporter ATP-binding protein BtuD n=1 Tax=Pluralibacter sp. TaxID=1920032 RepID=UPI0025F0B331|nr:vitamin B12 ABC transporter ATP-binding protein BtuD [Pluralibacter sp.]MBV8043705.1 vitamin B12 ABC transporter ATP-binding protein BtuD [Pluralibacter sp.]
MTMLLQLEAVEEAGRLAPFTAGARKGEILHLVGPNGAGKSTLLSRIAGLSGGKGRVIFDGKNLDDWAAPVLAQHRAFLSQHQTPPFAMPVWHYLSLHQYDTSQHALMQSVAASFSLEDKLARSVNQLSGGEWQRVRLAAVVLQIHPQGNPHGQLLVLDEPMSSLDVAQQAALDGVLGELRDAGITIVMSSHDLNHTLRFAQRVWLLCKGKLIASGETQQIMTTDNLQQIYRLPFKKMNVEGYQVLISTR